jgi:hypothetical protein
MVRPARSRRPPAMLAAIRSTPSVLFFVALAATACGGAAQTELFGAPGDGGDGGTNTDSGQSVDSSHNQGPGDSGGPADTSPGQPDTTMLPPAPDTGGPPSSLLPCGSGQPGCPAGPQEVCCITGDVPNLSFACSDSASCMGVPISCATTADCGGEICCGTETGTGSATRYTDVKCQPVCGGVHFCDPAASDCPSPTKCTASTLLPGYFVCRG